MSRMLRTTPTLVIGLALSIGCDPVDSSKKSRPLEQMPLARTKQASSASEQETPPCDPGGLSDAPVSLAWLEVPNENAQASVPNGLVTLELTNQLDGQVSIEDIEVWVDGPDRPTSRAYPSIVLDPYETRTFPVNARSLGVDPRDLDFSGHIGFEALVFIEGQRAWRLHSPPLYFHEPPGGEVVLYGERSMRQDFNRGDLNGASTITHVRPDLIRQVNVHVEE